MSDPDFKKLLCPICQKMFNYAENIPMLIQTCQHTICQNCVETTLILTEYFRCPECYLTNTSTQINQSQKSNMQKNQNLLDQILQISLTTALQFCPFHPKEKTNKICAEINCDFRGFTCKKCLKTMHMKCQNLLNIEVEEIMDNIRNQDDQFDFPKISVLLTRAITDNIKRIQDNLLTLVNLCLQTAQKETSVNVPLEPETDTLNKLTKKATLKYVESNKSIRAIANNEVKVSMFVENLAKFILEDQNGLWSHIDSVTNKMLAYVLLPYLDFRKKQTGFETEINFKITKLVEEYCENFSRITFEMEAINSLDLFYEKIEKACFIKKSRFTNLKEELKNALNSSQIIEKGTRVSDVSEGFMFSGNLEGKKIFLRKAPVPSIFEDLKNPVKVVQLKNTNKLEVRNVFKIKLQNSVARINPIIKEKQEKLTNQEKVRIIIAEKLPEKQNVEIPESIFSKQFSDELAFIKNECMNFKTILKNHCCLNKNSIEVQLKIRKDISEYLNSEIKNETQKIQNSRPKITQEKSTQTENKKDYKHEFREFEFTPRRRNSLKNKIMYEESSFFKLQRMANSLHEPRLCSLRKLPPIDFAETSKITTSNNFTKNPKFSSKEFKILISQQDNSDILKTENLNVKIKILPQPKTNQSIDTSSQILHHNFSLPNNFHLNEEDSQQEIPDLPNQKTSIKNIETTFSIPADVPVVSQEFHHKQAGNSSYKKQEFTQTHSFLSFKKTPFQIHQTTVAPLPLSPFSRLHSLQMTESPSFVLTEPSIMSRKAPLMFVRGTDWIHHKNIKIKEVGNTCLINRQFDSIDSNEFCAINSVPLKESCAFRFKINAIAEDLPYFPVGFLNHFDLQNIEKNNCLDIFNSPKSNNRFFFSGYSHSINIQGNKIALTANSRKGFKVGSSIYIECDFGKFIRFYNDDKSIFLEGKMSPDQETLYLYVILFRPGNSGTVERIF